MLYTGYKVGNYNGGLWYTKKIKEGEGRAEEKKKKKKKTEYK